MKLCYIRWILPRWLVSLLERNLETDPPWDDWRQVWEWYSHKPRHTKDCWQPLDPRREAQSGAPQRLQNPERRCLPAACSHQFMELCHSSPRNQHLPRCKCSSVPCTALVSPTEALTLVVNRNAHVSPLCVLVVLLASGGIELGVNFDPRVLISVSLFAPEKCIKSKENEGGQCYWNAQGMDSLPLEVVMYCSVWLCMYGYLNVWEKGRLVAKERELGRCIEREKKGTEDILPKQFTFWS